MARRLVFVLGQKDWKAGSHFYSNIGKWDKFVDVISQSELSSSDRLRVILKPGSSSKENVSTTCLCVE